MTEAPAELLAKAASLHVVVVGGGVSGLIAARECAKVGLRVTVLEAEEHAGGAIRRADLGGVVIDAGAESYATRGGHVRALVEELGLADAIVTPNPAGAWLAGVPGAAPAPLPKGGVLGIPENPFDVSVRRIIGWRGVWRAWVDRLRPPLTIGHEHSLGTLVSSRMGARVRDRLVAPVTAGVYSAHPDDIDVDIAAPGLNAALTRAGSLSGAVGMLIAEREARAAKAPGSAVEGLRGGMMTLVDALLVELEGLRVAVRAATRVQELRRDDEGWRVVLSGADEAADEALDADAVIVATAEPAAHALLAPHVPDLGEAGQTPHIEIVSLLLDAAGLADPPRGTGVLTVPGSFTAKALTHATAKWAWLRTAAQEKEVVRVSFGTQGEVAATSALSDEDAAALALREASAMLGVPLGPENLLAAHRERFAQSQPAALKGAAARRARARAAIAAVPRLAAVGAWLAGTGLAQVIPDAEAQADQLRHELLWD